LLFAGLPLVTSVLFTGTAHADFVYASGAGTSGDPYIIDTCAQLQSITDLSVTSGVYFQLGSNIDCDVAPYNTGSGFTPIKATGGFAGTLDGNGHVITGLYINDTTDFDVGMFYKTNNATIENLGIIDASVTASKDGGSIAGTLIGLYSGGVVKNVYATGQVTTNEYAAGLVGEGGTITIQDSYTDMSLTADTYEAGILGYSWQSTVLNSYSAGSFAVTGANTGAISGYTGQTTITNSYGVNSSLIGANAGGNTINGGSAGGQTLASFYRTSPLASVYTASPAWNFTSPWYFNDDSSLPIFASSLAQDTGEDGGSGNDASVPNSGDANGDGIQDSTQTNLAGLINPVTGKYALLQAGSACTISNQSIAASASEAAQDSGYSYPAGLMNFSLQSCGVAGYTTTVTQYYYGLTGSNFVLRKYNPNTKHYTTITNAIVSTVTIGGQSVIKVSYPITDGGALDEDGTVNGTIVDPAGLAVTNLTDTGLNLTATSILAGSLIVAAVGTSFVSRRRLDHRS